MSIIPRYDLATGTELHSGNEKWLISQKSDSGYIAQNATTHESSELPFETLVRLLKKANTKIVEPLVSNRSRTSLRLKGLESHHCASKGQQALGNFKVALSVGVEQLQERLRAEKGNPAYEITEAELNKPQNRKMVQAVAERFFGPRIYVEKPRGGKSSSWVMFRGRVLKRDFLRYEQAKVDGIDPLDALIPLDHCKGNRVARLPWELAQLMTQAFEEEGGTTRRPSPSNVMTYLETLIWDENKSRQANGLPSLVVPSLPTLTAHIKNLLSSTALDIMLKGKKHTQNSRGRGSTDFRALQVGEYVEIDECRLSLMVCAKKRGIWENLSHDRRAALKDIDDKICSRYTLVAVIDVATRMPLAWVLTEHPNTEATLEALRMATRDKTREQKKYGCKFAPMPALGIGHIKNDNGTALRNQTVKQAILGIYAVNTDARVGAATDKPYVERLFGTTESRLLKLIDGYTGRKAGEMKEYDANAQALLVVDELYAEITRFMIDDYPAMRHYGHGMFGCRPREMYSKINDTRGVWGPMDPTQRRLALGWKVEVTPNDEGVRVFGGIWFNSEELQEDDQFDEKVTVYIDPDNLQQATVAIPRHPNLITVDLQSTVFADMTLAEVFDFMIEVRADNLEATEFYDDHLNQVRSELFGRIQRRRKERRISGSFISREEAEKLAQQAFAGVRLIRQSSVDNAAPPDDLTHFGTGSKSYPVGTARELIEHHSVSPFDGAETTSAPDEAKLKQKSVPDPSSNGLVESPSRQSQESTAKPLGRPRNVRKLL